MKNGKYQNGGSKRIMVLALALVLLIGCTIGGTIAWLMDTTQSVENTFTVGNIDIELNESDNDDADTDADKNTYKIIPGKTDSKDPKVTVKANSEACWVFVKIDVANNTTNQNAAFVAYEIADGWTQLNGTNVYYREQDATAVDVTYSVLKNDQVSYSGTLTKGEIDALYNTDGTIKTESLPKLTFTAYAIQSANLTKTDGSAVSTAADAWALVNPTNP